MEESKVRNKATPAVRQLAQDLGLDLKHVQFEGSGPEGRILAEDVTRWACKKQRSRARPQAWAF